MEILANVGQNPEASWHAVALCPAPVPDPAMLKVSKMLVRHPRTLLAAATLTLLTACSKPKPPTITPKSAQVLAVGATGVMLEVAFDVANPNRFPLVVNAVDGRFLLGPGAGSELGKAHAEPASSIPAEGTSTVTSQIAIGWTNLAALTPFMLSPAAVPYRFEGNATVGGESLNVNLPFTLAGELTRAQLINAGLSGLSPPAGR